MTKNKTEIEQIGIRIIAEYKRFWSQNDTPWTVDVISPLVGESHNNVMLALSWLVGKDYIERSRGGYSLTMEGMAFYDRLRQNPYQDTNTGYHAWRDEALTGITQDRSDKSGYIVSDASNIKNGVVPKKISGSKTQSTYGFFRDGDSGAIRRMIAFELGLSVNEYDEFVAENRIAICSGHKDGEHVGIFDKKGNGIQHLCRECRKELRKCKNKK